MQQLRNRDMPRNKLELTDRLWLQVDSVKNAYPLIGSIVRTTRTVFNAAACSLLLTTDPNRKQLLKFSETPAGKQLSHVRLDRQPGITGWVLHNGQTATVNDVPADPRYNKMTDAASGVAARSMLCAPLTIHGATAGVIEVFNKLDRSGFSEHEKQIIEEIARTAALAIEKDRENQKLQESSKGVINALIAAADARETNATGHSMRVSRYAAMSAAAMSLPKEAGQLIKSAAMLHDIGKLGIRDELLNKSKALTEEEWQVMRRHSVIGYNLLKEIPAFQEQSRLVLYHHERYDGQGYPKGLKGEAIPIGARLIAVADAFDNMTTSRPYRTAMSHKAAVEELRRCAGKQFCPAAVKAFCSALVKNLLSGKLQA